MSISHSPFDHEKQARSDPRVGADHRIDMFCEGMPAPLQGCTRDLGIGGACVATPSMFSYRSVRRVRLYLPDGTVTLDAEGRWQAEEPSERVLLTGIHFIDPPEEAITRLWDLVLDTGKGVARFLYGRSDLAGFSVDEAVGIAQVSRWRNVAAGQFVYRGDVARSGANSIFVVHRGEVALQLRVRGISDRQVDRLGPGRLFGGLPLVSGGLRGESAQAVTDVRLLEIHEASFRYLCAAKPWLAHRLAQVVTQTYAQRAAALLAQVGDAL